jgi:hypothetical protein
MALRRCAYDTDLTDAAGLRCAPEILHRTLVLFRLFASRKRPQVPPPPGFGIALARIEAGFSGFQLRIMTS